MFVVYAFFFISGIFVSADMERVGYRGFIISRTKRLLFPWILSYFSLNLLTLIISLLHEGVTTELGESLLAYIPYAGYHLWFLWVLWLFNFLYLIGVVVNQRFPKKYKRDRSRYFKDPFFFMITSLVVTSCLYYLSVVWLGSGFTSIPFFSAQFSRFPLYFLYFFVGVHFGRLSVSESLLNPDSRQAKLWSLQLFIALSFCVLRLWLSGLSLSYPVLRHWVVLLMPAVTFFALLGFFNMFSRNGNFQNRLSINFSDNAFGIYLIHYLVVTACEIGMRQIFISPIVKAVIVFITALGVSWVVSEVVRRNWIFLQKKSFGGRL